MTKTETGMETKTMIEAKTETATKTTNSLPARVLIADGDPLVCRALSRLLANSTSVQVIATSTDRDEVLELAGRLRPDVILVDAHTARIDGMELTRSLCRLGPATRVIMLGLYNSLRDEALKAGACRFLLKDGTREELVEAIQLAGRGECQVDLGDMGENDSSGG
jgi:DNA-binding NarL/FixJ family response regulator